MDVFTLRCTARLMSRLNVEPETVTPQPTTRLGDWYANLIRVGRQQFVLAVSDRTLLPVVVAAAPNVTLVPRLRVAVVEVLSTLRCPLEGIEAEDAAMQQWVYGKTVNRQVLGVLVDFAKALPYYAEDESSLLAITMKLADTPCSPLYKTAVFPDRATHLLFSDAN